MRCLVAYWHRINGAEQKGGQFWWWVFLYFHEHRKFKPDIFESDRNDVSLSKLKDHIKPHVWFW
jgi:hypothetical protein